MAGRRGSLQSETVAQAVIWERVKVRYLRAGLRFACAAQAAWGHQVGAGGWCAINPPCEVCAELVAMFTYPTPNPVWRSVLRKRR